MMDDQNTLLERGRVIVRTSMIGILANLLLVGFKAAVGIFSHSIAVTMDAVNNLSDALSSVITIIGAKIAGKKPDRTHPFGHGRAEYLSALIVSAIVLYAGLTAMIESVKKIIHPEQADYSTVSLIIIAAAVAVKLLLGKYVKAIGEKVQSGSLIASGSDALFDAILSASVLGSAILFLTTGIGIEAYVGALIAVFIIKSGIEMMKDTIADILGKRPDTELAKQIKKIAAEDSEVYGAYDLIVHNYGPGLMVGSLHVSVLDTMTADRIDAMTRRIVERVAEKTGVILTGVGIYSINTKDDKAAEMRSQITRMVMAHEGILQVHAFYVDLEKKEGRFDAVMDFAVEDREALIAQLLEEIHERYPDVHFIIQPDLDSSE